MRIRLLTMMLAATPLLAVGPVPAMAHVPEPCLTIVENKLSPLVQEKQAAMERLLPELDRLIAVTIGEQLTQPDVAEGVLGYI